jgi:hypothetical protein
MGNQGGKKRGSTDLTPKRLYFLWNSFVGNLLFLQILEVAMLRANTSYSEKGK